MGFDPGDGQVVMPADWGEKAQNSLNEGLVAAGFDGVVSEEADAVLTVGEEIVMCFRATVVKGLAQPRTH